MAETRELYPMSLRGFFLVNIIHATQFMSSADISIFSPKNQQFFHIEKCRKELLLHA